MSSSASRPAPRARDSWSGQTGFLLAAIGSAIGLGNIWRFPGVSYSNGGGAFLVPYLVALIFVGIPMLWLDYAVGHKFRGSPPWALRKDHRRRRVHRLVPDLRLLRHHGLLRCGPRVGRAVHDLLRERGLGRRPDDLLH